jgi:high-affinity iron transporter
MLSTILVIFREFFEISIILSIILLATNGLKHRERFIVIGITLGIAGALLLAIFASNITQMADGFGQEIVNIIILSAAVLMILWTLLWMKKNSKNLSQSFKNVGKQVQEGEKPKIILSLLIASAIFREGSEIILFLGGIVAGGVTDIDLLLGSIIGLIIGTIFGILFYLGLLKFSTKHVFTFTSWLLIILASGLSAQIANNLVQADIIHMFITPIWDSSWLISDTSYTGEMLNSLIGYTSNPSGIEFMFYSITLITLAIILNSGQKTKK